MKHTTQPVIAATFALCAFFAAGADAQTCVFQHPAIARSAACAQAGGIDPNTFIVQPPAMVSWRSDEDAGATGTPYAATQPVPAQRLQHTSHPAMAAARIQREAPRRAANI